MNARLPVVVLISGRGSNLKAIIDAASRDLPVEIRAVLCNRPQAPGLAHARAAGIPTEVIDHHGFPDRAAFDAALRERIERFAPALVVLAGFMRVLTDGFVRHFRGRLINIHPSLLPRFAGLDTHRRALEAGVAEHGASVHFVSEAVDGGPVIAQARVPVRPGDTPEVLADRVLAREHLLLPETIRWFAEGRLRLEGEVAMLDGRPALPPSPAP